MADREKVIKGLECCIKRDPDDKTRCGECPYEGACLNRLKSDALALLKAQEPVEPVFHANITLESSVWRCGACNVALLFRDQNYCHSCGKPVKWDD